MRRLFLPSVIVLSFFSFSVWRAEIAADQAWWVLPSRVAFGLVLILAWRLRRGRIAWAALALAAAMEGLCSVSEPADMRLTIGLLIPLALGVVACLQEWWVFSRLGLIRALFIVLGAGLVYFSTLPTADEAIEGISSWGLSSVEATQKDSEGSASLSALQAWRSSIGTAPAVLGALSVGLCLCLFGLWKKRTPVEAGLAGALAASALAYGHPTELRFFATASALILGAALVENAFSLAFHDGLTGLPARRALEERLGQVGRSYALAMMDLDHFKKFNDKHGHEVGDQVLRLVASRMAKVSGGGEAFRYGGEEFTVVFAGRSATEVKPHLEALREDIAGRKFTVRSPGRPSKKPKGVLPKRTPMITKELKVTVSIGVAERSAKYPGPDEVMKAADKALYQAKKAGRNRVAVAKP